MTLSLMSFKKIELGINNLMEFHLILSMVIKQCLPIYSKDRFREEKYLKKPSKIILESHYNVDSILMLKL